MDSIAVLLGQQLSLRDVDDKTDDGYDESIRNDFLKEIWFRQRHSKTMQVCKAARLNLS